jgi:hypothetical protein
MLVMTILRRFIVLQLFLFWQGGFLFYSGVVVPVGTEVLGSALLQGTITQLVTNWLNLIGCVWCLVFAWDIWATSDGRKWRRLLRWALLAKCVLLLLALVAIHPRLDEMLDAETLRISNAKQFRFWHVFYLWISTVHWVIGLVLAWLTLQSWRNEDQNSVAPVGQLSSGM